MGTQEAQVRALAGPVLLVNLLHLEVALVVVVQTDKHNLPLNNPQVGHVLRERDPTKGEQCAK